MRSQRVRTRTGGRTSLGLLCAAAATLFVLVLAAPAYADPPTTTVKELTGWEDSAFTIALTCNAGTTAGDELYATRYRMDWEPDFHVYQWSDKVTAGWVWGTYGFIHNDGVHQCYFYSTGHNDNTDAYEDEATRSTTVRIDTTAPTVSVASKPVGWVNSARSLTLTAAGPTCPTPRVCRRSI